MTGWAGRRFWKLTSRWQANSSEPDSHERIEDANELDANLVSSHCNGYGPGHQVGPGISCSMHYPCLDLDFPCELIESSTPGHYHLYLNPVGGLTWDQYSRLLVVMGEIGLLEVGFVQASLKRGGTYLRPPWIRKDKEWFTKREQLMTLQLQREDELAEARARMLLRKIIIPTPEGEE